MEGSSGWAGSNVGISLRTVCVCSLFLSLLVGVFHIGSQVFVSESSLGSIELAAGLAPEFEDFAGKGLIAIPDGKLKVYIITAKDLGFQGICIYDYMEKQQGSTGLAKEVPGTGARPQSEFTLGQIFYSRLKRSPFIVKDPEEAVAFYVHYDPGVDYRFCRCQRGIAKMEAALQKWQNGKYWNRYNGSDHFIVSSRSYAHGSKTKCGLHLSKRIFKIVPELWGWSTSRVLNPQVVTKLMDELGRKTCQKRSCLTYKNRLYPNKAAPSFLSLPEKQLPFYTVRAVPWPSIFKPQINPGLGKRRWLTAYAGGTVYPPYRKTLKAACNVSKACNVFYLDRTHFSLKNAKTLLSLRRVYEEATFCFMPRGDDTTRRAFFDSLQVGCIPIMFEDTFLDAQYTWHIPAPHEISVYFPTPRTVANVIEYIRILSGWSTERIVGMQVRIRDMKQSLSWTDGTRGVDAFDISMKKYREYLSQL